MLVGGTRGEGRKPRVPGSGAFYLDGLRTASSTGLRLRGTYQPIWLRVLRGCAIAQSGWRYLYERGQYTEAEPLYERALAIREKALGPEHPDVATTLENYASLLRKMDRSQEAEPLESRARAIRAKKRLIRNPGSEPGR